MLYVLLIRQVLLASWFVFGYTISDNVNDYMAQLAQLGSFMFANCVGYLFYHLLLMKYSNRYPKLSYDNRSYVLKNLTKSTCLGLMSFMTIRDMVSIAITGKWDNKFLTFLGNMYVSTDLTGLLTVPGLSFNTQMHHTVVAILGMVNILSNYEEPGIHRAIVVMAYLSILPYLVNTMLGIRHLQIHSHLVNYILPWFCIIVYSGCVICNVFFQVFYVVYVSEQSLFNLIFMKDHIGLSELGSIGTNLAFLMAYYVILIDDCQLIKYLHYKATHDESETKTESEYKKHMALVFDQLRKLKI